MPSEPPALLSTAPRRWEPRQGGGRPGAGAASRGRGPQGSSAAGLFPPGGAAEEQRDGSWRGVCTGQMETGAVRSHSSSLAPAALLGVLSKFRWRLKFLTRGFKSFLSPAKRGLNALQLFPGARRGTHVSAAGARAAGRRAARDAAPPRPGLREHDGGTAPVSPSTESSKAAQTGAAPTVRGFCPPTHSRSPASERPRELQRHNDGTLRNAALSLLQTKISKSVFSSHPYRDTPLS